jgi:hypothetical protein
MSNCNKCSSFLKIDAEIKRQHYLDLAYKQRLQNISSLVKKQNNYSFLKQKHNKNIQGSSSPTFSCFI